MKRENNPESVSDSELVQRAQTQPAAFEALYRKYYSSVLRFVRSRVRSDADAADITQAVFIKALTSIGKYRDQGHAFTAWLFRIALNEITTQARKNTRLRAMYAGYSEVSDLLAEVSEPTVSHQMLGEALNALKETDRQLVEMRYFEQLKLKDIAVLMDWSESNAKVRMHRTLKRLSAALQTAKS